MTKLNLLNEYFVELLMEDDADIVIPNPTNLEVGCWYKLSDILGISATDNASYSTLKQYWDVLFNRIKEINTSLTDEDIINLLESNKLISFLDFIKEDILSENIEEFKVRVNETLTKI